MLTRAARGLAVDKINELGRQLDIGADLVLGGAGDTANLIAHALQVEVHVDDRLQQTEVGSDRGLRGDEVVAHGLEICAAGVDGQRSLLRLLGEPR